MLKKLLLIVAVIFTISANAQYTTPNTGVVWSLADLLLNAPSAISFSNGVYTLSQDLTIAEDDAIIINEDTTLEVDAGVLITVAGSFTADADEITITASDTENPFEGFRFEETSTGVFRNTTITYGGGIRVITGDFTMDFCNVSYNVTGEATGSAISFSSGSPVVSNSTFMFNDLPAFSSGANQEVSALFLNNYLEGNNQLNSNRPQINMGPGGTGVLRIIGNTIIGKPELTMVGGIAAASLLGNPNAVIIDNNIIQGNRYGITVVGANSSGFIRGNIIEDNNTQNNPNLGGSGISLSASGPATMDIVASNNQFRRNLWGITLIGSARINLGNTDPEDFNEGGNIFDDNGNGGQTYALYNNTPNMVYAMNNCWFEEGELTMENVENVITHQPDIATLGLVIFNPFGCALSTPDFSIAGPVIYPNPSNGTMTVTTPLYGTATFYNISGQLVATQKLTAGDNQISVDLPSGIYILKTEGGNKSFTDKLVIE
ncbi:MAG: T9SS type A sorting domain-containing protein [Flavobacterium sp.]|nr:MAG: T9SS type A sorting domain-containing protein [Flavobacterium sp.]